MVYSMLNGSRLLIFRLVVIKLWHRRIVVKVPGSKAVTLGEDFFDFTLVAWKAPSTFHTSRKPFVYRLTRPWCLFTSEQGRSVSLCCCDSALVSYYTHLLGPKR